MVLTVAQDGSYEIVVYPCVTGFDELTCTCGAEVLLPPIPCGTRPPECHQPCTREHACKHPGIHLALTCCLTIPVIWNLRPVKAQISLRIGPV